MLLDVYLGLGDVSLAREAHSNEMGLHLENEISFIGSDGCESPFSRSLRLQSWRRFFFALSVFIWSWLVFSCSKAESLSVRLPET